jgi:formate dehydrogenase subunit gamma
MSTATARGRSRSGSKKAPVARRTVSPEPQWITRFSVSQRVQHAVLVVAFVVLVITGLPQKYPDWPLATWTITRLGGIDSARLIHRSVAVVLILQAAYHVLDLGLSALRGRLRPTMVPNLKDGFDAMTTLRYSLGLAPSPPKFDRYEYRQKFEYWGVIFGTTVMVVTGLILWFPAIATKALPGELVPAAREAHGGEATLSLLTIVTWHLYSVLFSPAQFPGDFSIFTGRISKERMEEEHPLEYTRVQAAARPTERGRPNAGAASPEPRPGRWRWRRPRGPDGNRGRRGRG